jgi:hypothetical protein
MRAEASFRKSLLRQLEADEKARRRDALRAFTAAERAARKERAAELAEARYECKENRARVIREARERYRAAVERARETRNAARAAARRECELRKEHATKRAADKIALTRAKRAEEKRYQAEMRSLETYKRKQAKAAGRSAKEKRQESDDEVRRNLPPQLLPLFERVKGKIKGSARQTRTEAFEQYAQEHRAEVIEATDAHAEREFHRLQREEWKRAKKQRGADLSDVPFLVQAGGPSRRDGLHQLEATRVAVPVLSHLEPSPLRQPQEAVRVVLRGVRAVKILVLRGVDDHNRHRGELAAEPDRAANHRDKGPVGAGALPVCTEATPGVDKHEGRREPARLVRRLLPLVRLDHVERRARHGRAIGEEGDERERLFRGDHEPRTPGGVRDPRAPAERERGLSRAGGTTEQKARSERCAATKGRIEGSDPAPRAAHRIGRELGEQHRARPAADEPRRRRRPPARDRRDRALAQARQAAGRRALRFRAAGPA